MLPSLRALNGFGLGARVGEARRLRDPRGWLHEQLRGDAPRLPVPAEATPDAIAAAVSTFRDAARSEAEERARARQQARRRFVVIAAAESHATLSARAASERPFVERLVAFWSNHLCVSAGAKLLVAPLAGSYEREAIRPHVLGRFADMVLASAKHPAMLLYLDNAQSTGPRSRIGAETAARTGRAARGLNENYARELLELHTLGVSGGYTQTDVQELARVLTGWAVSGTTRRAPGARRRSRRDSIPAPLAGPAAGLVGFEFQRARHEPGAKTVLGVRYEEAGVDEGERVIAALCRHPSTARFVAAKLARHFVSDQPPAAAIDRLAEVFRATDGDLRALAGALIDLPGAWTESARKFRTPQDWLVALLRALDLRDPADTLLPLLRQLRHPLWSPPAPNGYGDTAAEWADPDSLLNRAELARTLARRLRARAPDPAQLLDVIDAPAGGALARLLSDASIPVEERVALAAAGPAFQWR